jgi:hypothetical protein
MPPDKKLTPEELSAKWLEAKQREDLGKADRIMVEQDLLKCGLETKTEGQITHSLNGFKLTFKQELRRSLDIPKLNKIRGAIPVDMLPTNIITSIMGEIPTPLLHQLKKSLPDKAIDQSEVLDMDGLRWLETERPDLYKVFATALTVTPAKPSVKIVKEES